MAAKTQANKTQTKEAKPKVMSKSQIISHLAEKFEISKRLTGEFLQEIADLAISETKKNGVFVIPGIGKLVKAQRKARVGVNPQTRAKVKIPAKTVVKFRVMKAAKEAVAPGKK
jgi:DNA-binding protein HU-beta